MSLIFDALQRSEGERSGVDLASISTAPDLLQLVERGTASEWETAVQPEQEDTTEYSRHNPVFTLEEGPLSATTEFPLENGLPLIHKQMDQLAHFQSLKIVSPQDQLVCLTDGESLAAEKFRFLGVRLRHLRRERPLHRLLITSTIPHEGKSMVAANLACTLARRKQQRTLLLEGDVRRPSLSQIFGVDRLPGLCEWLQGGQGELTNIYHLDGPDLWFLPAGSISSNPLELLQSRQLTALMDQLTKLFDWVIVDSPPVLPLADTSVWSRLVDGIMLVARQGTTEKRQLQRGLEALDQKKLIGTLLNCSQSSDSDGYDYPYYSPAVSHSTDHLGK